MSTHRKTAVVVGSLFILAAVTSIIGLILYGPLLNDADYVTGGDAHQAEIASGALLEVVAAFSLVGIAVLMFPIVRRRNEAVALGYASFRLMEATIIVIGAMSLLAVVTLNKDFTGADAASYLTGSKLLIAVHDWTFLFGPNLALGPSTLMMGVFLHRTRLVPRTIAILGMVGGTLIFVSAVPVLFGAYDQLSVWGAVGALPVFAYEMSLAVWLIAKGFHPAAMAALPVRP
ncbi:hypothetical protein F4553_000493 [Allocatelliglobosispora scoriae]|uniref:DUF4386 domain-containing protein n=1 Tax=Allocatelliglobosispora scoriae TaxID=643052 RepID=A0A841BFP8_9ACTN|nr:DUF4386 domain-containing protein [Allocatelliglobosispora scoriae]MBB5867114.1 hypothetical protein [Allocatelliglobosispora scoriae]